VTDLGGGSRLSKRRPRSIHLLRLVPVAGLLAVVVPAATSASAGATGPVSNEQAKAAQIEAQIQQTGRQIDGLDQRYEAALEKKAALDARISATQAQIDRSLVVIARDKTLLQKTAIEAYVSGGTSAAADALFSTSQTLAMDSSVYSQVVTGDLNTSMEDLHTAIAQLDTQRQTLKGEDAQAAGSVATARAAYEQAQTLETQQNAALAQAKGQIATLISQQRAAAEAVQEAAAQATIEEAPAAPAPAPPPAASGGGEAAVQAAETQVGVPYVWGAEDPGAGFDCSGLTAWAWGQAGVYLPHYSGAQMADSTPVPISDLDPGDLLFYGPGGSVHVAMYVGGGMMIEATLPGTVVRVDPVRFGTTFAGAGRP
jgi:peptidoglycan DL-endopeptidase CwlO